MRVLIWVSKGLLEDLAKVATREEQNMELLGVTTEVADVKEALLRGDVDILMIGMGRMKLWTEIWESNLLNDVPTFCPILVSSLPLSGAQLLEASSVGIFDVVDLTMDRDDMGQRLIDGFKGLRRRVPESTSTIEKRINESAVFRLLTDETDRKIVSLVAQGKFDKEIAEELYLSLQTIRNRLSRILTEFGARNRTHLALLFTHRTVDDGPHDASVVSLHDGGVDVDPHPDDQVA